MGQPNTEINFCPIEPQFSRLPKKLNVAVRRALSRALADIRSDISKGKTGYEAIRHLRFRFANPSLELTIYFELLENIMVARRLLYDRFSRVITPTKDVIACAQKRKRAVQVSELVELRIADHIERHVWHHGWSETGHFSKKVKHNPLGWLTDWFAAPTIH